MNNKDNTRIKTIERAIQNANGRLLWASQIEGVASRMYCYQVGKEPVIIQTFIQDGYESCYTMWTQRPGMLISDDVEFIDGLTKYSRTPPEGELTWSEEHQDYI